MRGALAIVALAAAFAPAFVRAQPAQPAQQEERVLTQSPEDIGEIRNMRLGVKVEDFATEPFGDYACGGNGGAPGQKLSGWAEFKRCRPEANGLREVWVRFADQIELYARAIENDAMAQRLGGTRVAGFQVILSVLFDDQGVSRGFRMITDPRAAVQERRVGFMFRQRIQLRYGIEGWTCTDLPPAQGETPVGGVFIKVDCEKRTPERNLFVQARFLRKAGQFDYDPVTREPGVGQFESQTRFEIFDPGFGPAGG